MTIQSDFIYYECPYCGFDSVQRVDFDGDDLCPLCLEDCGHEHHMSKRMACSTDRPEGRDARDGS